MYSTLVSDVMLAFPGLADTFDLEYEYVHVSTLSLTVVLNGRPNNEVTCSFVVSFFTIDFARSMGKSLPYSPVLVVEKQPARSKMLTITTFFIITASYSEYEEKSYCIHRITSPPVPLNLRAN